MQTVLTRFLPESSGQFPSELEERYCLIISFAEHQQQSCQLDPVWLSYQSLQDFTKVFGGIVADRNAWICSAFFSFSKSAMQLVIFVLIYFFFLLHLAKLQAQDSAFTQL